MRSLPAEPPVVLEPTFKDGLGVRTTRTDGTGDTIESLDVCAEIAAMRSSVRDRVDRLAKFRHARFAPLRGATIPTDGACSIEILSDHVAGTRVSAFLDAAGAGRVAIDTGAALHVAREVLAALAVLYEARAITHGAIGPERVIVTARGRVVVSDYVFGLALERLDLSPSRLWRDFRIPVPPRVKRARFDEHADVIQVGVLTLALLAGRPLEAIDYPGRLSRIVDALTVSDGGDRLRPLPARIKAWLAGMLPVEARKRFTTAREAQMALETALSKQDLVSASASALKALFDAHHREAVTRAAAGVAAPVPARNPSQRGSRGASPASSALASNQADGDEALASALEMAHSSAAAAAPPVVVRFPDGARVEDEPRHVSRALKGPGTADTPSDWTIAVNALLRDSTAAPADDAAGASGAVAVDRRGEVHTASSGAAGAGPAEPAPWIIESNAVANEPIVVNRGADAADDTRTGSSIETWSAAPVPESSVLEDESASEWTIDVNAILEEALADGDAIPVDLSLAAATDETSALPVSAVEPSAITEPPAAIALAAIVEPPDVAAEAEPTSAWTIDVNAILAEALADGDAIPVDLSLAAETDETSALPGPAVEPSAIIEPSPAIALAAIVEPQDVVESQRLVEPSAIVEPQDVVEPQRLAEPHAIIVEPQDVAAQAEPDAAWTIAANAILEKARADGDAMPVDLSPAAATDLTSALAVPAVESSAISEPSAAPALAAIVEPQDFVESQWLVEPRGVVEPQDVAAEAEPDAAWTIDVNAILEEARADGDALAVDLSLAAATDETSALPVSAVEPSAITEPPAAIALAAIVEPQDVVAEAEPDAAWTIDVNAILEEARADGDALAVDLSLAAATDETSALPVSAVEPSAITEPRAAIALAAIVEPQDVVAEAEPDAAWTIDVNAILAEVRADGDALAVDLSLAVATDETSALPVSAVEPSAISEPSAAPALAAIVEPQDVVESQWLVEPHAIAEPQDVAAEAEPDAAWTIDVNAILAETLADGDALAVDLSLAAATDETSALPVSAVEPSAFIEPSAAPALAAIVEPQDVVESQRLVEPSAIVEPRNVAAEAEPDAGWTIDVNAILAEALADGDAMPVDLSLAAATDETSALPVPAVEPSTIVEPSAAPALAAVVEPQDVVESQRLAEPHAIVEAQDVVVVAEAEPDAAWTIDVNAILAEAQAGRDVMPEVSSSVVAMEGPVVDSPPVAALPLYDPQALPEVVGVNAGMSDAFSMGQEDAGADSRSASISRDTGETHAGAVETPLIADPPPPDWIMDAEQLPAPDQAAVDAPAFASAGTAQAGMLSSSRPGAASMADDRAPVGSSTQASRQDAADVAATSGVAGAGPSGDLDDDWTREVKTEPLAQPIEQSTGRRVRRRAAIRPVRLPSRTMMTDSARASAPARRDGPGPRPEPAVRRDTPPARPVATPAERRPELAPEMPAASRIQAEAVARVEAPPVTGVVPPQEAQPDRSLEAREIARLNQSVLVHGEAPADASAAASIQIVPPPADESGDIGSPDPAPVVRRAMPRPLDGGQSIGAALLAPFVWAFGPAIRLVGAVGAGAVAVVLWMVRAVLQGIRGVAGGSVNAVAWLFRSLAHAGHAGGAAAVSAVGGVLGFVGRAVQAVGSATFGTLAWLVRSTGRAAQAAGTTVAAALAWLIRSTGRAVSQVVWAARTGSTWALRSTWGAVRETARATGSALASLGRGVGAAGRYVGSATLGVGAWTVRAAGRVATWILDGTVRALAFAAQASRSAGSVALAGATGLVRSVAGAARIMASGAAGAVAWVARSAARASLVVVVGLWQGVVWLVRATWAVAYATGAATIAGAAWAFHSVGRMSGRGGEATAGVLRSAMDLVRRIPHPEVRPAYLLAVPLIVVAIVGIPRVKADWFIPAARVGTVRVTSTPAGLAVRVDGVEVGKTPLTATLAVGKHRVEYAGVGPGRVQDIVVSGKEETLVGAIGLRPAGRVRVVSQPEGAEVWLDGARQGKAPLTIDNVAAGGHTVLLRGASGSVQETIRVRAGETSDATIPIYSGWLAVFAPVELSIHEDGRVLGTTESGRLLVSPGAHVIEVASERYGFKTTLTVVVKPGAVAAVNVQMPALAVEIVAPPEAEIVVDGQTVGTAPLEPVMMAIGTHDVIMRHATLGERHQTIAVAYGSPNRILFE